MNQDVAREAFYEALLDDDPEKLYEQAPCGYLSTTPDGTIIKVNQTFLTWTGFSRQDLVARRTFSQLLSPGGRIYHETHYAPMLRMHDSVREIALDIVRADGRRLPVLVNATLERDSEGIPSVVRTAVFDASERREYERELLRAKQRAEESEARVRALAHTLQQTLIPPTPPDIPGLDVAAVYRPAGAGDEVGGDFYDIFQVGVDDWVVALGDVCGKGVEAAAVTALVRHTVRAAVVQLPTPGATLARLNQVLLDHETDRFCTIVLVRLRRVRGTWTVTLSAGGHPLPLLVGADGGASVLGRPGSLVGVLDTPAFHDVEAGLEAGESLLLYTDGVTEGRRDGDFYGDDRLHASLAAQPRCAGSLVEGLLADVLHFQDDRPRDDIALVAVHVPEKPGEA
ncbi:MAG: SpoIIE family protein phosphatase [Actinomycetota bacterium]|nr:SpoIIE family protein phosphatase [Actinomycetota bacterium]